MWQRLDAEEQADLDIAFLFELVMRLELAADEMCRVGGYRYGMLFWEGRAINAERHLPENIEPGGSRPTIAERREAWRAAVEAFRADLAVGTEVRQGLEDRYLDGHVALFPETLARWQRLREAVEDLPYLAPPEGPTVEPEPDAGWVEADTGHLLRWARVRALDLIGDGEGAMALVESSMRIPPATADPSLAREDPPSRGAPRPNGSRP